MQGVWQMSCLTSINSESKLLQPIRRWLESIEVNDRKLTRLLCSLIPVRCPFEREVKLFKRTVFHMPPLCRINPLYEQVVALRFKALSYLADKCGEDVALYC